MTELAHTSYVLGTDETEKTRLRDQHRIWRDDTLALWQRAEIVSGSHVLDVGAGPGFASADLCDLVGPTGRVVAAERSIHYIKACLEIKATHSYNNFFIQSVDLMSDPLPEGPFDATWCRWVCSFLPDPDVLIQKIAKVVRPGGRAVFAEYANYESWRMLPNEPMVDTFVSRVISRWKNTGSTANAAPLVLSALQKHGFEILETTPRIFCCGPGDPHWTWVTAYMKINTARNLSDGLITSDWAHGFLNMLERCETLGTPRMLTPMVLEIIARKI